MKKMVFLLAMCQISAVQALDSSDIAPEKIMVCAACHGAKGISTNPEWPNLAGQHAGYLVKQLNDFKKALHRKAPTMIPMVSALNENDIAQIAAFYAAEPKATGETPAQYVTRGQQLYRGGDFDTHITACIACHGPQGTGNAQAGFPSLSGQHAAYTLQQLQAFKNKTRSNDLNGIMRDISARMSTEDMEAVAYYIEGLH